MNCKGTEPERINGIDYCPLCGKPMVASGVDGGSWVHLDTSADRVVLTEYAYGKWIRTVLANGVTIRPKATFSGD